MRFLVFGIACALFATALMGRGQHLLTVSSDLPRYNVTCLGSLGGNSYHASHAFDINSRGQVVGSASALPTGNEHAFVWQNGKLTDVGTLPGGSDSSAKAINAAGMVVGKSSGSADRPDRAFFYRNGRVSELGTLGGPNSDANGINHLGHVVGEAMDAEHNYQPFAYRNGRMERLLLLVEKGGVGRACAINNKGQIVGQSDTPDGAIHAVLWQQGTVQDLGTLGGTKSSAHAINDAGQVVGDSDVRVGQYQRYRAFLWSRGKMSDLGSLGSGYSRAWDINNKGQVVGESYPGEGASAGRHAFLYTNGRMLDLNTLIPPDSGWRLISAKAINDAGQIVGHGKYQGRLFAFLLTPGNSKME